MPTVISIFKLPPSTSVAIGASGFNISISASGSISPAVTIPGVFLDNLIILFSPLAWFLITIDFKFNTIAVTSSITPSIFWNSCATPSIFTEVIASPGKEDNITLLKALPKVVPKPLSNGSNSNLP